MTCQFVVRRLYAVSLAVLLTGPVAAAEFCASNAIQLWSALNTAASNGEDDIIRIATGTYNAGGLFTFSYDALAAGGDDHHLTLIGGYSEFFGNPCGQRLIDDPLLTVLDAGGVRRVLRIALRNNSNLTVRLLTFANGNTPDSNIGGGLWIERGSNAVGSVDIERNVFINNEADAGGALASRGAGGRLRLINNLIIGNHSRSVFGAVDLRRYDGVFGILVTNNTVINNTLEQPASNTVGGLYVTGSTSKFVANNNLWGNDGRDLWITTTGSSYTRRNNNFGSYAGSTPTQTSNDISVTPEYEFGPLNFTPKRSSPLVDGGTHPALLSSWYLTEHDLRYHTRVVGGTVDIGAYENEHLFQNGFQNPAPLAMPSSR